MGVVFEQVEEGVVDEVEGAVEVALNAEIELEWSAGLVAHGEGDVLEIAGAVGYVLSFSDRGIVVSAKAERETGLD